MQFGACLNLWILLVLVLCSTKSILSQNFCNENCISNGGSTNSVKWKPFDIQCDCSHYGLEKIPTDLLRKDLNVLNLSNNKIETIPAGTFTNFTELRDLDLSYNILRELHTGSLTGLYLLEKLNLKRNLFCLNYDSLPLKTFSYLPNLISLDLSIDRNLLADCVRNTNYHLIKDIINEVPSLSNFLFNTVEGLWSIMERGHIVETRLYGCILESDTFKALTDIKEEIETLVLRDSACPDDEGFIERQNSNHSLYVSPFPKLKSLVLICTSNFGFQYSTQILHQISSEVLEDLVLDNVNPESSQLRTMLDNVVQKDSFCANSTKNVKRVSLRGNFLQGLDVNFLQCLPKLEHLVLGYNYFFYVYPPHINLQTDAAVKHIQESNIQTIDISNLYSLSKAEYTDRYCEPPNNHRFDFFKQLKSKIIPNLHANATKEYYNPETTISQVFQHLPKNLTVVYASNLNSPVSVMIKNAKTTKPVSLPYNNVQYINISGNPIGYLVTLTGLNSLQIADLSYCKLLGFYGHIEAPVLQTLLLKGNQLKSIDDIFIEYFNRSIMLKHLDLSLNRIHHVALGAFTSFPMLSLLDLSQNQLHAPKFTVSGTQLIWLDLSNNQIVHISNDTILEWEEMTSELLFQVDLSHNQFQCDCASLDLLNYLKSDTSAVIMRQKLTCYYKYKTVPITTIVMDQFIQKCQFNNPVTNQRKQLLHTIIAIVIVVILTVPFLGVIYQKRWWFRWNFHRMNRALRPRLLMDNDLHLFGYHAFISHPSDDNSLSFINENLLPMAEDTWGLKTCIPERDFMIGSSIPDNICSCISQARKVLILVTQAYIDNPWSEFELHMALCSKGLDEIVVCMLEEVENNGLPPSLFQLLYQNRPIMWTDDPDGKRLFWEKLRKAVMHHAP